VAYPDDLSNLPANRTDWTGAPADAPSTARISAAAANAVETAINQIEDTLGLTPQGSAASVAARLAALDTTVAGKLATSGTAADTAAVGGVTVTGTASAGLVLKATSPTAATWQADATGGGGSSITIDADGTISDGTTTIEVALDADVTALSASTTAALAAKAGTVHAHSAADITSGTLPLARGGTGGTDAATARAALGAPALTAVTAALGAPSTATTGTLVAGQMALVDATSAAIARTLPAANSVAAGTVTGVKKIDGSANVVTVSRAGGDTITGTAVGQTSRALTLAGESVELTSDGVSAWVITSTDTPSPSLTGTYAPLASPALTGNPTAPTPSAGDNDTSIATTAFAAPRPVGTPTVGQVPVVTTVSPLALGWGTLSASSNGVKRVFGAVGDMRVVTDATVTAASTTLTSPTAAFTAGDVGKTVAIPYAGADNGTLTVGRTHLTTIAAVVSATQATLASAPTKSVTAGRTITDGAINNNSSTLNSATANWTSADIGKRIVIPGAGRIRANAQRADMVTWIVAIQSATAATVLGASRATVSGRTVAIPGAWVGVGTDDTAAFTAAASVRGSIEIEPGSYMVTGELPVLSRTTWWGYGAGRSIVSYCGVGGSAWRYEGGTQNSGTITDVTFRDFEIDGSGSRVATYSSVNKGIYITNCVRLTCANMYIHDTSATAFGCDFLPDGYMVGNVIERGGAQVPELGGTAGGSGFGIGTGFFHHEAFTIIGNVVRWCGKNGIFTESQSGNIRSRGARIIGNHVEDCGFGISDRACDGTIIQGNTVVGGWPGSTGIYIGGGFVAGLYSISAQVLDNVVICDGQAEGITSITNAGDLTIRGNDIRLAGTAGIRVTTVTGGTLGTLVVDGNSCLDAQGTARGVWVADGTWDRIIIEGNRVRNCGAPATPRPAIVSGASAAAMYVRGNILWDNRGGSAGMSHGLQLTGGTVTRLVYDGNDTVGAITAQQDLTGATITTTVTNTNP
jgi:hypothetical protein